ncbi:LuxR C-terminal-related transcriptional regulator [Nostocoides sp.]|uniref:response regulator transcription factor n=1 Tax=Nostocoides sp. TaxID=1917966 RepID=UPI002B9DDDD6|nr:response regulator transcription factor [Tetrasphaera sp.]
MRVVVAEDHALLRDGLTRLLTAYGVEVALALDGTDGLAAALAREDIDAAILDVRLPPTFTDEGLRAAIAARAARPGFPVMVLSQYVEHLYARELLASGDGGVGYLLKDRVADAGDFVDSVRRVAAGGTVLDPEVVATLMSRRRIEPVERLTERERDVIALMAQGRSNAAIAGALFVSEKAVAKHINGIFTKLDLPVAGDDHRRVLAVLAWLKV